MTNKKTLTFFSMLFLSLAALAQKQYYLPTAESAADEKDRPMIEVYLPKDEAANGCAVVLCPGGAMRWLSWDYDRDLECSNDSVAEGQGIYQQKMT